MADQQRRLNLHQRTRLIRTALTGPNGKALLEFLMDEHVLNESPVTNRTKMAMEAGARALVLQLRRIATSTDEEPKV